MKVLIIIVVIIVLILLFAIKVYNGYVRLDTENQNAFSNISVFLQKRWDLIPNLVATVKGYAKHESETLEKIVEKRSSLGKVDINNIDDLEKLNKYENELSNTLKSILSITENYPDLKANENFLDLQGQLKEIETEIERSRRYYNATSTELNSYVRVFPNVIFSGIFRFRNAKLFEAEDNAHSNYKVEF